MDAYHPPETIDTNQEFESKSQAWRNALKWFKEREEVRRQEIIDTKRDSIRAMLKRDNSSRLVTRASQYGLTWEVVRNERGRKMIQTPDGMITIDQAREALVETMIPDNWGRQYAHFFHWFNGDFKLIGYAADGTRTILGSAITEPEAYEKLYAFKRANPGVYQRLVAEPAVRIDPDDAVRLSDAQRRRLEKMLADATGAYRDEVSDAMRGIVASKTSKRPFYAPLMERTGAGGFVTGPWDGRELSVSVRPLLGGRSIRGIAQGDSNPDVFIPMLVDLFMAGRFPFDRLVTVYPFDRIADALADGEAGRTVKAVLTF
jgi:hypothetical protein